MVWKKTRARKIELAVKWRFCNVKMVKPYAVIICEIRGKALPMCMKRGCLPIFRESFFSCYWLQKASSVVQKNPMLIHLYSVITSAERSLVALAVQVTIQVPSILWTVPQMDAMLLFQAVATFILHGSLARCHWLRHLFILSLVEFGCMLVKVSSCCCTHWDMH